MEFIINCDEICSFAIPFLSILFFLQMYRLPRFDEYKVLLYRILLAYLFYFIARVLFYLYNSDLIAIDDIGTFFKLSYHGLAFDTTAILYVNGLFVLFSIFPFYINTRKGYQTFLLYLYFISNLLAYALNFVDFIYYRYTFGRSTIAITDSIAHETNKGLLFFNFLVNYWHVYVLFAIFSFLWIYGYKKVKVPHTFILFKGWYFIVSVIGFLLIVTLCIGGIRGDFQKSTRPINLIDASRHVERRARTRLR